MGKPSAKCADGFFVGISSLHKVGGEFVHSRKLEDGIVCGARMSDDVGHRTLRWVCNFVYMDEDGRLVGGRTRNVYREV